LTKIKNIITKITTQPENNKMKIYYYVGIWLSLILFPIIMLKIIFTFVYLLSPRNPSVMTFDLVSIFYASILWGTLYLSLAIGLTLGYKVLKFPNFAVGEYFLIGGFIAIYIGSTDLFFSVSGNPHPYVLYVALFFGFIGTGVCAIIVDRLIFKPLRKRNVAPQTFMITSLGIALSLRAIIALRFGSRSYNLPTTQNELSPLRVPTLIIRIPLDMRFPEVSIFRGGGGLALTTFRIIDIMMIFILITTVITFFIFLKVSKPGIAMRAVASNPDLAASSGINVERIYMLTAFIVGGISGMGGVFFAVKFPIDLAQGLVFLIPAFAVIVLGSVGSLIGALIATFIVGFSRVYSEPMLTGVGQALSRSNYLAFNEIIPFVVLISVLLLYNQGIGNNIERRFNEFNLSNIFKIKNIKRGED
jgi:branched-chain amino acid transport system permease protein